MPKLMDLRDEAIEISLPDNIYVGYTVELDVKDDDGSLMDRVTAHWLVPGEDGSFRKATIDVTSPAALALNQAIFNSTKGDVS